MKFLIVFFFCTLTLTTLGQERVELSALKDKVGKFVIVHGKIDSISTTGKGDLRNIIIHVSGESPNELLSIFVEKKENIKSHYLFTNKKFAGSIVIVTGKVELLDKKPRITIKNADDLKFIIDEEVEENSL